MEVLKIPKGHVIVKRKDKVKGLYLIQDGSVIQKLDFAEITLRKNGIIGSLRNDEFVNDFIAAEDTTVVLLPCKNPEELKAVLDANERYRTVFLYAATIQRHQLFALYADLETRIRQYFSFVQTVYKDYHTN